MRGGLATTALLVLIASWTAACGSPTAPDGCSGSLVFSVLPVPIGAISAATPVGNLGPPTHTIPTDHAGFYLIGIGIPLSAPGALRITTVRTTRYLTSPFRMGQFDYAIYGNTCGGYTFNLGHLTTVVSKIGSQTGTNCTTYSTSEETVEACLNDHADISIAAGEALGTVGGATAGAFDFGLYQTGHSNGFVNSGRFSSMTNSAVCPYDPFTAGLRSEIDPLIGEPGRKASGESPICGTMNVDVAGTARGVWVLQSDPVNQSGNETNFAVLAPHPFFPQSGQTFSLGPAALGGPSGSPVAKYPVAVSGRVNRQFRDVTSDGLIYCYVQEAAPATVSYFVRLSGAVLTIQKVTHAAGASPCSADPSTWALNGTGLTFIR